MSRRSRVLAALAVVAALVVATTAFVLHRNREQEWRHGGDDVEVTAEVQAMRPHDFGAALEALGERSEPGMVRSEQMIIVRASWSAAASDGSYSFILLDDRVSPAKPLPGYGATGPGGGQGPGWDGRLQALSEHYPWLARTADREVADGWTNDSDAFEFRASEDGEAVMSFSLDRHAIPLAARERDLALALVHTDDDGEVRWAKRVPLAPLA